MAAASATVSVYQDALDRASESPSDADAIAIYRTILAAPPRAGEEKALEAAISALSILLAKQK
jgi:hypothetical protein